MTSAAINVLDNNPDGFFLMIEGGAADWASHANQSGRVIEEQIAFEKAIETVIEWVNKNSTWDDTLLIVTSDHETGYITGPDSGKTN
jgi:alkaline phosphatase